MNFMDQIILLSDSFELILHLNHNIYLTFINVSKLIFWIK